MQEKWKNLIREKRLFYLNKKKKLRMINIGE
jgi:hypothetical protein